jgi:glycosyltransferase involved in cell wall biosynthesis
MPLKVLLLSDTYSEHTEKWATGLASKGIHVGLFSFNKSSYNWFENNPNIKLLFQPDNGINSKLKFTKLNYLRYVKALKKAIDDFQPDVLHAHYATSYGLIGALSGFHPFVISSWGTDVMKFPQKNIVNKRLLKYNLKKADKLCATSHTIKSFINQIIKKPVEVIPFGVDLSVFKPKDVASPFGKSDFVVGCVKNLEKIYNVDVLIKSFALLCSKYDNLRLLLVGEGDEREHLERLCDQLEIRQKVLFTGRINFSEVSNYFNMIDVLVNISDYESFGVSVIEAMACGKPVIVTDVGGLREVVNSESVGIRVPVKDINGTAESIEKFYKNPELKKTVGLNGRKRVEELFNWENNVETMISNYRDLVKK